MFDINADNLSERLPYQKAERFRRLHEKWAELGIVTSYLAYMISNVKSHRSLLDALITASFIMNESKLARATKEIINISCNDIYKQALEEAPESVRSNKPKLLPLQILASISFLSQYGLSSEDYVKSYNLLNSQTAIQKTVSKLHTKINIKQFIDDLTNKLSKVLLSISENNERTIYSGVIIEAVRMSGNNAYIEPFKDDDILVRFIAERDDRTTKMCKSLDDQLFRTNGMNVYKRYSDSQKKIITMQTYGLKSGENLPPIADHFHWCRSTVTYMIDNTTAEFIRSHHNGNTKYWQHKR